MHDDGPEALAHQEDAIAHMRDLGWGFIAGGLVPILGHLLFDWTGASLLTCVLINVCLAQLDRASTFLLGIPDADEERRYRRIWKICEFLIGWRSRPHGVLHRGARSEWIMGSGEALWFALLAIVISGGALPALLLSEFGGTGLGTILAGCGVSFVCYFLLRLFRSSSRAASAGFATDHVVEQYFGWAVGFMAFANVMNLGPPEQPDDFAGTGLFLGTLCVLFGLYRLLCASRRQRLATWLRSTLEANS